MRPPFYTYHINLDERGEFFADLRDGAGSTVWEVHTKEAVGLVRDGLVTNIRDGEQVMGYLKAAGLVPGEAVLASAGDPQSQRADGSSAPIESLYGPHTVTVRVKAISPCVGDLHPLDRDMLTFLQRPHVFMINDLPRLVQEFTPRFPDDMLGMGAAERARFVLEETALDRFHSDVAIKVLEDFEIVAESSPEAVAEVMRLMMDEPDNDASPSP